MSYYGDTTYYGHVKEILRDCRVICDMSDGKQQARERITERYNAELMKIIEDCAFYREMKAKRGG